VSNTDLQGKTAVVTGASLGIGRATAIALGRSGANVVVNYHSHSEAAEEVVQAVRAAGAQAIPVQADVSDPAAVERLVAEAVAQFGAVDIAISNAAYSERESFHEAKMDGFRRTVEVTMWGAYHLLRSATQQMLRQAKGGAIVMVSSPHAYIPVPKSMAYNMAKAAVDMMAKTAAIEVARAGIRVNIIHPGWIDTPGERKYATEESLRRAGEFIPLGRLGTPEEIAEAILVLCDPRHAYMTGTSLLVDGGISLPWWSLPLE
jgi:glucose 1-dehydrogenase